MKTEMIIALGVWAFLHIAYLLIIWNHARILMKEQQVKLNKEACDLMEKYPNCETLADVKEEINRQRSVNAISNNTPLVIEYHKLHYRLNELRKQTISMIDTDELQSIDARLKEIDKGFQERNGTWSLPNYGNYTTFCEEMKKRENNPNYL